MRLFRYEKERSAKLSAKRSAMIRKMTSAAMFAALLCISAPWSVPIGAIPVSLATFAVYLTGLTLGRSGVMSAACYLLLGAVGLPVFSGFSGGVGVFAGPTGGFLAGYLPGVLVCGILCDIIAGRSASQTVRLIGYLFSAAASAGIIYSCGILWYVHITGQSLTVAAAVCVLPFVLPEIIKILAAAVLAPILRDRIAKIR